MELQHRIFWRKKVSDEEYLKFDYFIKNSCGYSSEKGLTGHRYNTCLINYSTKDDQLTLEIKSPIETSPKDTLEIILNAMKNGKSLLS
ncbi:MAG: hypothetical protein Q8R00_01410 [Candidatus Nanoarchaeia archaeon]|nr:hypothetical protein [Candidatus Nanoarchaeia archaeon]